MAKLKQNIIKLVVDPKAEEIKLQTYFTPKFIPFGLVYEAIDLIDDLETSEEKDLKPKEIMDKLMAMVVKIYDNQFEVQDLINRLHAPDAMATLREQVVFVTQGQQTNETKNFIASMK